MADAMLYQENGYFVVLETNQPEVILSVEELRDKLTGVVESLGDRLPQDLQRLDTTTDRVQSLIDQACELDLGPDAFLQWYAVRLEKPSFTKRKGGSAVIQ
ncbi:MAG: chlororespiratory reduction protein 7 [Oscillatoriales cyanobacterium]|nr:MAG: chlororespiratory reduction protein 7 [Oscillatoriales cyanobacterium]